MKTQSCISFRKQSETKYTGYKSGLVITYKIGLQPAGVSVDWWSSCDGIGSKLTLKETILSNFPVYFVTR